MSIMRSISSLAAATGIALALSAAPANAAVLYDNGPANGSYVAGASWISLINMGIRNADTFSLSNTSILTNANFSVWNYIGDVTQFVDWSIVGDPIAGPVLASGTAAVTSSFEFQQVGGIDVNLDSIALPNIALAAGTYWFELQNAVSAYHIPIYWNMNGGPSQNWDNVFGYNPGPSTYPSGLNNSSNSFQILGTSDVPEPATLALFGLGLLGLGLSRRKPN